MCALRQLHNFGVLPNIDIIVFDDISGIEEATRSVFPFSDHQLCVVHAMRGARTKVRRKDCAEVLADLKIIYRAPSREEAEESLSSLAERWKKHYLGLVRYWRENFSHPTVFMKYPEQVRPYIYTTNQLDRINKELKRRTKTIEAFSSEESLMSVLFLILKHENEKLQQRRLRGFGSLKSVEEG